MLVILRFIYVNTKVLSLTFYLFSFYLQGRESDTFHMLVSSQSFQISWYCNRQESEAEIQSRSPTGRQRSSYLHHHLRPQSVPISKKLESAADPRFKFKLPAMQHAYSKWQAALRTESNSHFPLENACFM